MVGLLGCCDGLLAARLRLLFLLLGLLLLLLRLNAALSSHFRTSSGFFRPFARGRYRRRLLLRKLRCCVNFPLHGRQLGAHFLEAAIAAVVEGSERGHKNDHTNDPRDSSHTSILALLCGYGPDGVAAK